MNPYLTEKGSEMVFSSDYSSLFPCLEGYELDENSADARIYGCYEKALSFAERKLGKRGNVLDVGCGSGHFLETAVSRGWRAFGIDFDEESLKKARQTSEAVLYCGKISDAPFEIESFDLVTMWDYLEHVEDPPAVLKKAAQLLKPGGMLVVACPNFGGLLFKAVNFVYRVSGGKMPGPVRILYPPTHLSYFSPIFMIREIRKRGFLEVGLHLDETDLSRVSVSGFIKLFLRGLFYAARIFKIPNRFVGYFMKA